MDESSVTHIKGVIEALLYVSEKPVTLEQIKDVLESVSGPEIKQTILALQKEYDDRESGMVILEIAGGYQMLSSPHHALSIRKFYKMRHKEKLSKPALETLAIVAYKQPVTRTDIESIRGVNSDGVSDHLLNKGLVKIVGRKDVPGKPYLYGTTKQFLEYFGLKSLNDLPKLEDFALLQTADDQQEEGQNPQNPQNPQSPVQQIPPTENAQPELPETTASSEEIIQEEVQTFIKETESFNDPENIRQEISQPSSESDATSTENSDESEKNQDTISQTTAALQENTP